MEQFSRIRRLLGEKPFERLRDSSVTVVGIGAVGSYVVEGLARAGVRHLRLVDFDTLQPSNLNRQIFALHSTLGQSKVLAAKERVLDIQPDCRVETFACFAAEKTLETLLTPAPDLLIDAIDSLNPKTQLLSFGYQQQIPTLSCMGAALRTDPGLIRTGDVMDTSNCPLARRLRQRLRKNKIGRGIICVYSTEKVDFCYGNEDQAPGGETMPHADRGRKRKTLGSLPTLTGIFGLTLANLAIRHLAAGSRPETG